MKYKRWARVALLCSIVFFAANRTKIDLTASGAASRRIPALSSTCGVITTILEVNPAVVHFVKYFDAPLIVVGDKKTDHVEWELFEAENEKVIYLHPTEQRYLRFRIIKHIPWNHFGRKSIGFMYAIAAGCTRIYDFDDDNHLMNGGYKTLSDWQRVELRATSGDALHVFNPYPYFKPSNKTFIWPRGFPFQFIRDERTHDVNSASIKVTDSFKPFESLAVVQSLADHDPDVDAVYRLTQPLPIYFERGKTILVPDRGIYTPWNAQAVLVSYPAFFGLLLPVTVTGRVSDIWRSYITSRLLWETNYTIGFASPFVEQHRNPHNYMVDFKDEADLYNRVDALLSALASWTTADQVTLADAYLTLIAKLTKQGGILAREDLRLAQAWVHDLAEYGYVWPSITNRMPSKNLQTADVVDQRERLSTSRDVESAQKRHVERTSIGAFMVTRNDGYGDNQIERATVALERMLQVLDEVVLVDMNTVYEKEPFLNTLPRSIRTSDKLKHVIINPDDCATELGAACEDKMYEALGRKIGLREASADVLISTNPEVLIPSRRTIERMVELGINSSFDAVILPRKDVEASNVAGMLEEEDVQDVQIVQSRRVTDWSAGPIGLMDVSMIVNCGDFQMARSDLWKKSNGFALKHGHNFGDSNMIARWLSSGATVRVLNVPVMHVKHAGKRGNPSTWNPKPLFVVVEDPQTGVKRIQSSWDE